MMLNKFCLAMLKDELIVTVDAAHDLVNQGQINAK